MAPVSEVADVFRRHGEAFRQGRAGHLGRVERRVMGAITACRTAALGGHVEQCDDCAATRIAYNSCRNRHCPKCQGLAVGRVKTTWKYGTGNSSACRCASHSARASPWHLGQWRLRQEL